VLFIPKLEILVVLLLQSRPIMNISKVKVIKFKGLTLVSNITRRITSNNANPDLSKS